MPQNALATTVAVRSGVQLPLNIDKQGGLLSDMIHGERYIAAYTDALKLGANPSGVTTSAGLATTYVGLCLSNPAANTVNLSVRRVMGQFLVAPVTVTGLGLIVGYSAAGIITHTTALTPFSAKIGLGAAPVATLDSACTLVGTPVWAAYLAETGTATSLPSFTFSSDGSILLPPGAYCAIGTTIAGPASGFVGAFEWEEIPV